MGKGQESRQAANGQPMEAPGCWPGEEVEKDGQRDPTHSTELPLWLHNLLGKGQPGLAGGTESRQACSLWTHIVGFSPRSDIHLQAPTSLATEWGQTPLVAPVLPCLGLAPAVPWLWGAAVRLGCETRSGHHPLNRNPPLFLGRDPRQPTEKCWRAQELTSLTKLAGMPPLPQ